MVCIQKTKSLAEMLILITLDAFSASVGIHGETMPVKIWLTRFSTARDNKASEHFQTTVCGPWPYRQIAKLPGSYLFVDQSVFGVKQIFDHAVISSAL
jgi:hypothetical protein